MATYPGLEVARLTPRRLVTLFLHIPAVLAERRGASLGGRHDLIRNAREGVRRDDLAGVLLREAPTSEHPEDHV